MGKDFNIGTPSAASLSDKQSKVLGLFYSKPETKVVFDKAARQKIWDDFKKDRTIPDRDFENKCPALFWEMKKAQGGSNLIQSAIFSECVYAQTLANLLGLDKFFVGEESLPDSVKPLLRENNLSPRYIYKSDDENLILVQAGGSGGIDSALISVKESSIYNIEFKEPLSKISEVDLPRYGEDGYLVSSREFINKNPQFKAMLQEKIESSLNFWEVLGSNVNNFSDESVQKAVSENYDSEKHADAICVEDNEGNLTLIPANQATLWANIKGEIRPAGRNAYEVWTPNYLEKSIIELGGETDENGIVTIPESALVTASPRGGNGDISRYKINPVFFVRIHDIVKASGNIIFDLKKVEQLRPTISAHMDYKKLKFKSVLGYYKSLL
jgi:hypothetical protein